MDCNLKHKLWPYIGLTNADKRTDANYRRAGCKQYGHETKLQRLARNTRKQFFCVTWDDVVNNDLRKTFGASLSSLFREAAEGTADAEKNWQLFQAADSSSTALVIGVVTGARGLASRKFLTHLIMSCFDRRSLKQNTVARSKSKYCMWPSTNV